MRLDLEGMMEEREKGILRRNGIGSVIAIVIVTWKEKGLENEAAEGAETEVEWIGSTTTTGMGGTVVGTGSETEAGMWICHETGVGRGTGLVPLLSMVTGHQEAQSGSING